MGSQPTLGILLQWAATGISVDVAPYSSAGWAEEGISEETTPYSGASWAEKGIFEETAPIGFCRIDLFRQILGGISTRLGYIGNF